MNPIFGSQLLTWLSPEEKGITAEVPVTLLRGAFLYPMSLSLSIGQHCQPYP
ncbi:Uncharacterised protein [Raoultella terrigena]|uniref:Uncharacterized protein n=1 Tax=Raoultella terrigena TaxID=577 RepID=A0A3P8KNQ2_RAOTE|nr:Uncharacterised protein [Raoultella terrigena]